MFLPTCSEVTFPPLSQPIKAGTRFIDPGVDLVGLVAQKGGIYTRLKTVTHPSTKDKVLVYSLLRVWAVNPQVTKPSTGRLSLLSTRLAVTFPAAERHRSWVGTKFYCLETKAHACEQLAEGCYPEADRLRFEPATFWVSSKNTQAHSTNRAQR